MSDNPFDMRIAAIDKAVEDAKRSALPKITPVDVAKARSQQVKQELADKIAPFQTAVADAILQRADQKNWTRTREEVAVLGGLVAYLTSTRPMDLNVRPHQDVYNSARDIFFGMLDRADFPPGTFNGERDRKRPHSTHSTERSNVVYMDKRKPRNRKQQRGRAKSAS